MEIVGRREEDTFEGGEEMPRAAAVEQQVTSKEGDLELLMDNGQGKTDFVCEVPWASWREH